MNADRQTMLIESSQALQATNVGRERPILDVTLIKSRADLIRKMADIMRPDVHYGKIPGTDKPSLFQPGAQLIASLFRLAMEPEIEDISPPGEVAYRVIMRATHGPSGVFLGSAPGICSTLETKYCWRRPVCDAEFNEADEADRQTVWKGGGRSSQPYQLKQVRQRPADIAQTILAMATKRAFVACVRQVSAASDLFTEGLEDLEPEARSGLLESQPNGRTAPIAANVHDTTADPEDYAGPTYGEVAAMLNGAATAEQLREVQALIRAMPQKIRGDLERLLLRRSEILNRG